MAVMAATMWAMAVIMEVMAATTEVTAVTLVATGTTNRFCRCRVSNTFGASEKSIQQSRHVRKLACLETLINESLAPNATATQLFKLG